MGRMKLIKRSLSKPRKSFFSIYRKRKNFDFSFDPKKSFFELHVLWAVVGSCVFISVASFIVITLNSSIELNLGYSGFNAFFEIFKFPLAFLALLIPLVAVMASNHRSVQTRQQISSSEEQTKFSNYFRHISEFESYISSHVNNNVKFSSLRQLYESIFPFSFIGNFQADEIFVVNFDDLLDPLVSGFNELLACDRGRILSLLASIEKNVRECEKKLNMTFLGDGDRTIELSGNTIVRLENGQMRTYLSCAIGRIQACIRVFEFESMFSRTDNMDYFFSLDSSRYTDDRIDSIR